jgi:hypothetical protein
LDATGAQIRVTEGGSLSVHDLELEEVGEAPNSGIDLIDPAFSEYPAQIKVKGEEVVDSSGAVHTSRKAPASVPPPLSAALKERRRHSLVAQAPLAEHSEAQSDRHLDAPVPDLMRAAEDSLAPHTLAGAGNDRNFGDEADDLLELEHAPPSTRPSERDKTFQSLYPDPSQVSEDEADTTVLAGYGGSQRSIRGQPESTGVGPGLRTPGAFVVGSDGRLRTQSEAYGGGPGGSTWLPWTIAAVSLLALGASLTAQFNGDFRRSAMESTGSLGSESQVMTYESKSQGNRPESLADQEGAASAEFGERVELEDGDRGLEAAGLNAKEINEAPSENSSVVPSRRQDSSPETKPTPSVTKAEQAPIVTATSPTATTSADASDDLESAESDVASEAVEAEVPPFDEGAAFGALGDATVLAKSCRREGDPAGTAHVTVTFAPSGRTTRSLVAGWPYAGTELGGCIAQRFRAAKVPEFSGGPVTVHRSVVIQ